MDKKIINMGGIAISSIAVFSGIKILKNRVKMYEIIPRKYEDVLMPPEVVKTSANVEEINFKKKKINKIITNFKELLEEDILNENLTLFYNNLSNLDIVLLKNVMNYKDSTPSVGEYDAISNRIMICKKNLKLINHELFHLASTYYDNENEQIYYGFCQLDLKKSVAIGKGLNEGYTQYLTENYIKDEKIRGYYPFETHFAYLLELTVGSTLMKNLYFTANLRGLIDELEKYTSKEEIMEFIYYFDYIIEVLHKNTITEQEYHITLGYMHLLSLFLTKCFVKKLDYGILNHVISPKKGLKMFKEFLGILKYEIYHGGICWASYDEGRIMEILEESTKGTHFSSYFGVYVNKKI